MTKQKNLQRRLGVWVLVVGLVLLIPYVTGAPWTASDYIFAGIVLYVFAVIYELVTKKMHNKRHKIAVGFGIITMIAAIIAWAATGP